MTNIPCEVDAISDTLIPTSAFRIGHAAPMRMTPGRSSTPLKMKIEPTIIAAGAASISPYSQIILPVATGSDEARYPPIGWANNHPAANFHHLLRYSAGLPCNQRSDKNIDASSDS